MSVSACNVNFTPSTPLEASEQIRTLPPKIFERIFSCLSLSDLQNPAQVSKTFNAEVVVAANLKTQKTLVSFIKKIVSHLDPEKDAETIEKLHLEICRIFVNPDYKNDEKSFQEFQSSIFMLTCLNFPNLGSIKEFLLKSQDRLIDILMHLPKDKIESLKRQIPAPDEIKDIFSIIPFALRMDYAKKERPPFSIPSIDTRVTFRIDVNDLDSIIHDLLSAGLFTTALRAIPDLYGDKLITSPFYQKHYQTKATAKVCVALVDVGCYEKALEIALHYAECKDQPLLLATLAKRLAETENFDRAVAIVQQLPDKVAISITTETSDCLDKIAELLARSHRYDEAYQTASKISPKFARSRTLLKMCQIAAEASDMPKAYHILQKLDEPLYAAEALAHISVSLAKAGRKELSSKTLEKALEYSFSEGSSQLLGLHLIGLCSTLSKGHLFDEALEIAFKLPSDDSCHYIALRSISKHMAQARFFERARQTLSLIKDLDNQSRAYIDLAKSLKDADLLNEALTALGDSLRVAQEDQNTITRSTNVHNVISVLRAPDFRQKALKQGLEEAFLQLQSFAKAAGEQAIKAMKEASALNKNMWGL